MRDLYRRLREQEVPHEEAIRLMLARVFVSPAFLYRAETAPPGKLTAPVNDYEMANRLSYFLWSSMPDAELRRLADTGKLRTPAAVQAQARRMVRTIACAGLRQSSARPGCTSTASKHSTKRANATSRHSEICVAPCTRNPSGSSRTSSRTTARFSACWTPTILS